MSMTEKIDQIIDFRHKHLEPINNSVNFIDSAYEAVQQFDMYIKRLDADVESSNLETYNSLININTTPFNKLYTEVKKEIEWLRSRFSRNNINLSFVGKAGQGKSLVLQSISGLGGEIIPSAEGSDCTGARSIITNVDSNEVVAEISFFEESEIVEKVNKYIEKAVSDDRIKVRTIDDIKRLKGYDWGDNADPDSIEYLNKYINNINEYENYLGRDKPISISADLIEEYVSQFNHKDSKEKYYKYLGVKLADIKCRFPCSDAGKIVLVDTVGLGSLALGVEDDMRYTLKHDSDAIVYMFFPTGTRRTPRKEDISILKDIIDCISEEYSSKMLFWVVNRADDGKFENVADVEACVKTIIDKDYKIANVFNTNCSDHDDVEKTLLIPILNQIANDMEQIDQLLIDRVNVRIIELYSAFSSISTQIRKSFSATISQDVRRYFEGDINELLARWTGYLKQLRREKQKNRNDNYEPINKILKEKMNNVFNIIPSIDEISHQLERGDLNRTKIYDDIRDNMRLKIIDDFFTIDESLKEIVDEMKKEILSIVASKDKGKLELIIHKDIDKPNDWIDELLILIEEDEQFIDITNAFKTLKNFNLSVKGSLIFDVRNSLDPLDPIITQAPNFVGYENADSDAFARTIEYHLRNAAEKVFKALSGDCERFSQIPHRAIFAAVSDFYDRCTFSGRKVDTKGINVLSQWRYFYEDHLGELWKDEVDMIYEQQNKEKDWNSLVQMITQYNQKDKFMI